MQWCGPCKIAEKQLAKMTSKYSDVRFGKCNCDEEENKTLASEMSIVELPTMIAYKNGKALARFSGVTSMGEVMGLAEIWNERFDAH